MSRNHRAGAFSLRATLGIPLASLAAGVHAADNAGQLQELPTVYVSATAIREDARHIASSFHLLEGPELFERAQGTLGDTLNGLPGVHADTFGGGASRPVIRGQSVPRVKVLSDSGALLDASDISPDHAITTEPLLVERIEVLRGPATLLFGSGAMGGVVNVLDRKIPTARPEKSLGGAVAVRGASAGDEGAAALQMTARATDHLVLHGEGALRNAGDYRAPGFDKPGVGGTWAKSGSGSVGLSWVDDNGYLGMAYTYRDDSYGLPGHNHEYESCHPHGSALHCGSHDEEEGEHDHEHENGDEEVPVIELLSKRFDLRGEIASPFAGVERIRLRASHTDYQHSEVEEGAAGTTFRNEGYEARVEIQHAPLAGLRGVAGARYSNTRFTAEGDEAFMPVTRTASLGLFLVEHYELNEAWHFEMGLRHEWLEHRPVNDPRGRPAFDDTATSVSAAAVWEVAPDYRLTLSTARSERLPHAQELYARGIHLATNSYECGMVPHPSTCGGVANNAEIATETSNNVELFLRRTAGSLTFAVGGYFNQIDHYIYARTLDQFEDFRLIKYTQQDATFQGMEAEVTYQFAGNFSATLLGDYVRAERDAGGNLPRIPAGRIGTRLSTTTAGIGAELEYLRIMKQSRIADHEVATPGHDMLNMTFRYSPAGNPGYSVYVRGSNLLDGLAWNHSSFLAGVVPLQGRSLGLGMRLTF